MELYACSRLLMHACEDGGNEIRNAKITWSCNSLMFAPLCPIMTPADRLGITNRACKMKMNRITYQQHEGNFSFEEVRIPVSTGFGQQRPQRRRRQRQRLDLRQWTREAAFKKGVKPRADLARGTPARRWAISSGPGELVRVLEPWQH